MALKAKGLSRRLLSQQRHIIHFGSNDYLALSSDKVLRSHLREALETHAVGSGAARVLLPCHSVFEETETCLASHKAAETALLVASGWQTNVAVLSALLRRQLFIGKGGVAVFSDRANHHSLHQGCLLAGVRQQRYRHLDIEHLETLLRTTTARYRYIVSETVFSMDGDCADVAALVALARRYDAFLYLDDAHAMGVMGRKGFGLTAGIDGVDLTMSSFGKGMGCFGAGVTCSSVLRAYLINHCGGFLYSTALPPFLVALMLASMRRVAELTSRRRALLAMAERLRQQLRADGYDCLASTTPIIPILVSGVDHVQRVARCLLAKGFYVPAIRAPTVAKGQERLRLSLTSAASMAGYRGVFRRIACVLSPARRDRGGVMTARVCVLAAGWACDKRLWQDMTADLSGYHLVFYDANMDDTSDALLSLRRQATTLVGIGHSFGLNRLLACGSALWDGLLSISGFLCLVAQADNPTGVPARVLQRMQKTFQRTPQAVLADFYQRCGVKDMMMADKMPESLLLQQLVALSSVDGRDVWHAYRKRGCPTVAVHARDDAIVPYAMAHAQFSDLQADYHEWENGGHFLPVTKPKECRRLVADFLRSYADSS